MLFLPKDKVLPGVGRECEGAECGNWMKQELASPHRRPKAGCEREEEWSEHVEDTMLRVPGSSALMQGGEGQGQGLHAHKLT